MDSSNPSPLPTSTDEIALLEQQVATGTAPQEIRNALARAYHEMGQLALQQNRPTDAQHALARYLRLAVDPIDRRETLKQLQNLVGDEPLICEQCGRKSPIASAFEFSEEPGSETLMCPRCSSKAFKVKGKPYREPTNSFIGWAFIGGIALISYDIAPDIHYFSINILLVFLYYALLILVHEIAHGLTAFLLGGTVFALDIGRKALLWKFRVGTCVIRIHQWLFGGAAYYAFPPLPHRRIRRIAATAAPLAVHLLIALVTIPYAWFEWALINYQYLPFQMFWWTNAVMIVMNATPRRFRRDGQAMQTDGAHLRDHWRGKKADEHPLTTYYYSGVHAFLEEGEYEKALAWCDKGLAVTPDHFNTLLMKGWILLKRGRHPEGQALLTPLLHQEMTQLSKGNLETNLTWSLLLTGQTEEAFHHAQCGYALLPWDLSMTGAMGATFVETSHFQEGIVLLQEVCNLTPDPSCLAYLALAHARLGEIDKSQRCWNHATVLAPNDEFVAHVRPKLESMGY